MAAVLIYQVGWAIAQCLAEDAARTGDSGPLGRAPNSVVPHIASHAELAAGIAPMRAEVTVTRNEVTATRSEVMALCVEFGDRLRAAHAEVAATRAELEARIELIRAFCFRPYGPKELGAKIGIAQDKVAAARADLSAYITVVHGVCGGLKADVAALKRTVQGTQAAMELELRAAAAAH